MNRPAKKLRSALQKAGLTMSELSSELGLNLRSLRNVACGSSASRPARQKITDRLGVQIWPAVHPKTEGISIRAGLRMRYPSVALATAALQSQDSQVLVRMGRDVIFVADCNLRPAPAAREGSRTRQSEKDNSFEIIIDQVSPQQLAAARTKGTRK